MEKIVLVKLIIRKLRKVDEKISKVKRIGGIEVVEEIEKENKKGFRKEGLKNLVRIEMIVIKKEVIGYGKRIEGKCIEK